ncbi:MAG TPA: hypothetical protein VK694_07940 [Verrucomicrobiae bacterium]|nr:hypothetical protein [Verrucomicrobiae bacterium]
MNSEEGLESKRVLRQMDADTAYNTQPTYSSNTKLYPDNLIPFVDKHMDYLCSHPATDPQHYISNLRLISRLK